MTQLEGRRMKLVVLLGASIATTGCLPIQKGDKIVPPKDPKYESVLQVRFLGVGGFLLRRGADVIMTAPLYSNPSKDELLGEIRPAVDRIEKFHPKTPDTKAILVGHAHYDHLMDVPYVWEQSQNAIIYGNRSMKHILNGYVRNAGNEPVPHIAEDRIEALNEHGTNRVDYRQCVEREGPTTLAKMRVGKPEDIAGRWIYVPGTNVRIRALCSEHPAQVLTIVHLWPGCVHRPRFTPPCSANHYQEGETFAYLIDFLDDTGTKPLFRVYYQDAPTSGRLGEVPDALVRKKAIDVAILCVGNFHDVDDPTHIVTNTKPRAVILGHWENFFRPQKSRPPAIPFAKVRRVIRDVERELERSVGRGVPVILPDPQATFVFEANGVTKGSGATAALPSN